MRRRAAKSKIDKGREMKQKGEILATPHQTHTYIYYLLKRGG